jgi:hypothetical protein
MDKTEYKLGSNQKEIKANQAKVDPNLKEIRVV